MTEADLKKCFSPICTLTDIKIIRNQWKNSCKGYAFVTIADGEENLEKVLSARLYLDGKMLDLSEAISETNKSSYIQKQMEHKIHVKNLRKTVNDAALKEFFNQYGEVVNCYVIYNPHTGASKRFGYVEFVNSESVDKVLAEPEVLFLKKRVVVNRYAQKKIYPRETELQTGAPADGTQNGSLVKPASNFESTTGGSEKVSVHEIFGSETELLGIKTSKNVLKNSHSKFNPNCDSNFPQNQNSQLQRPSIPLSQPNSPKAFQYGVQQRSPQAFTGISPTNQIPPPRHITTPFSHVNDFTYLSDSQNYQYDAAQAYYPEYQQTAYAQQQQQYPQEEAGYYYYYDYDNTSDATGHYDVQNFQEPTQPVQEYYYVADYTAEIHQTAQQYYQAPQSHHQAPQSHHQAPQRNYQIPHANGSEVQNYQAQNNWVQSSHLPAYAPATLEDHSQGYAPQIQSEVYGQPGQYFTY